MVHYALSTRMSHELSTDYGFVKLAQVKSVVRLNDRLNMTMAVDLDIKPQTKQKHHLQFA